MQRISKILKGDNFIPEFGYIIITAGGMVVYNGHIGINYSRKLTGERLCSIADEAGAYAIPEPLKFLKIISVLESITSVQLDKTSQQIKISFAGKGEIKIPVMLNLSKETPHLAIDWCDKNDKDGKHIEVTSLWNELNTLTTTEGEALWGDVIGIYGSDKRLVAFDYGVYLHSEGIEIPDFYCPKALIELGLRGIDYANINGDEVQLIGNDVKYICTGVAKSQVVTDMMSLKEEFNKGKKQKITLDFTSGVWRRAKLLADEVLLLQIKNNQIFLQCDSWKECIGKTEAKDAEFNTRISLLERWASGTFEHAVSVTDDGTWNLYGVTRGGVKFYGVLTDIAETTKTTKAKEKPTTDIADIPEGESLL